MEALLEGVQWPPCLFTHSFYFHCSNQTGDRLCQWLIPILLGGLPGWCQSEGQLDHSSLPRGIFSAERACGENRETKVQANAAGQSRKIRRETWVLKQGRCSPRCCSAAATLKQGTWRFAAEQPPQPCCCPRWHLHLLPPLVSHSHHSSSDILSMLSQSLSSTGGRVERSRRLRLSLLQET